MGLFTKKNPELDKFAEILRKSVVALFNERGEIKFSTPPELTKKQIIEFDGKIRANGMNDSTMTSPMSQRLIFT